MRTIDFRVDVLRNGVSERSLQFDAQSPPSIDCDASADICVTMRGSFVTDSEVDFLTDELQPVVVIDGVEHKLGVFRAATVQEVTDFGAFRSEVEAYDRTILLQWGKLESHAYHASGTQYSTIITNYLTAAGITSYILEPTSATLGSAREWDIGTSYLQIINELLDELAYNHIWFDGEGTAILKAYRDPSELTVSHVYGRGSAMDYHLIAPTHSREMDIYSKPNVFIAIRTSPDYTSPLTATAENNSLTSPLSTIRRGIRIPVVYRVNNIASQDALQTYVNRLRDRGTEAFETVDISTAIQPDHGVGDIVEIEDAQLQGIYRETGWTLTMGAGEYMTHSLERTVVQDG